MQYTVWNTGDFFVILLQQYTICPQHGHLMSSIVMASTCQPVGRADWLLYKQTKWKLSSSVVTARFSAEVLTYKNDRKLLLKLLPVLEA